MSLEEMWDRLEKHQPYADEQGYGPEWAKMCAERTEEAAEAAAWAAARAAEAWAAALAAARAVDAARAAVDWIERAEAQE